MPYTLCSVPLRAYDFALKKSPFHIRMGFFLALCSLLSVVTLDSQQKPRVPPPDFPRLP